MVARGRVRIKIDTPAAKRIALALVEDHVQGTAKDIADLARIRAPRRTGALASTIQVRTRRTASKVTARIGANVPWAAVAHNGAKPHMILPRNPGGRLRFYWAKVGHYVSLPAVNHPGMRGTNYLTGPLSSRAPLGNFRVTIH